MKQSCFASTAALTAFLLVCTVVAGGQQSFYERIRGQNTAMIEVQPTWMGPLIQSDARLSQVAKFSVAHFFSPGMQTISYGNNHGFSLLGGRRFQFDFDPPSFFRNHSAILKDGWGNAAAQVKYRMASGNADHGNFALTAILAEGFASGATQNGMLTSYYCPKLAAGKAWGWLDFQTTLGAVLPTGKIAAQGRTIEWNGTAQLHPNAHAWLDVENNAALFLGGPDDGKSQNFLTPAAFYSFRRREWAATHAVVVLDAGMQIATSRYHQYNHNLISEMRILF